MRASVVCVCCVSKESTDAGRKEVEDIEDLAREPTNPIRKATICIPFDK